MSGQTYITVTKEGLLSKAGELKNGGYTLSQVSVTSKECFDIIYSFEKEYELINVRLNIDKAEEIESVSNIYTYAYVYENEMKDLFGVKVQNLNLDFKGNFFKTSIKTPFNPSTPEGKVE